jgi:hypothetical protein
MLRHQAFQLRDKIPAHRGHQRCRWQRLTAMCESAHDPLLDLQSRHVEVEVHSPINREIDMSAENIGCGGTRAQSGTGTDYALMRTALVTS